MNLVNGDSCLRWAVGSMTHSTAFNTISDETGSTVLVAGTLAPEQQYLLI